MNAVFRDRADSDHAAPPFLRTVTGSGVTVRVRGAAGSVVVSFSRADLEQYLAEVRAIGTVVPRAEDPDPDTAGDDSSDEPDDRDATPLVSEPAGDPSAGHDPLPGREPDHDLGGEGRVREVLPL